MFVKAKKASTNGEMDEEKRRGITGIRITHLSNRQWLMQKTPLKANTPDSEMLNKTGD